MQVWLQFSSQRTEEVCVFVCVSERRQYFLEGKKERRNVVICWCDWKWEQVSPPLRFYRMVFIPFCKFSKRSVLFTMIEHCFFFHLQHQLNAFHLSISSILAFHSPAPWTGDAVAVAMVVVARWLLLEVWRYFFNWGKNWEKWKVFNCWGLCFKMIDSLLKASGHKVHYSAYCTFKIKLSLICYI